jgi:alkanesulfonate monooxygenase SsuD/methylene tetrahydromethanopterin reductase-like flavin-dependent oxidoreductase (luciferase family)
LKETAHFLRTDSAPVERFQAQAAAEDPLTIYQFGELQCGLHAAEALMERAAEAIDQANSSQGHIGRAGILVQPTQTAGWSPTSPPRCWQPLLRPRRSRLKIPIHVSGYLESAARNFGFDQQTQHNDRYELAEEYMEVCYKLWERSWDRDAVKRDRKKGIFANPAQVHGIAHTGKYFRVPGFHLSEPSPQRTPVLYQAGASRRGKEFAAKHAECVFVSAPSQAIVKSYVRDLRRSAAERRRGSILIFVMFTIIVAPTDDEAVAKFDEYRSYVDYEGALALMSGWTGVDLSQYRPDQELRAMETNANQSALESFTVSDPNRHWTIREIAEFVGIGGRGPVVVGSPGTVADELQRWMDETDVDGFNLTYVVIPEPIGTSSTCSSLNFNVGAFIRKSIGLAPYEKSCFNKARIFLKPIRETLAPCKEEVQELREFGSCRMRSRNSP